MNKDTTLLEHLQNAQIVDPVKVYKAAKRAYILNGFKWGIVYGILAGWAILCLGIIVEKPIEDYTNDVYFRGYYDGQESMEPIELTGDLLFDMSNIEIEDL